MFRGPDRAGLLGGSAITGVTGLISGGFAGSYAGTPGAYAMGDSWTQTAGSGGSSSYQIYSAVAAAEIDGSVVPKAGFVIAGLFWLLMQRRRQGASLDA